MDIKNLEKTAAEIKKCFAQSGKTHLLITGSKGSGKTTLARYIAGEGCGGYTSRAVPGEYVVLSDNITGEECIIGEFSPSAGRMLPMYNGFSTIGIKSIERAKKHKEIVLLDEIGYLESGALDFQKAVEELLDARDVIMTVRKEDTDFILKLRGRSDVFIVDMDNLRPGLGCVIMASGHSRRFGSNKLLAEFRGKKLIEWAISATDGIFEKRVVVTRYSEIAELCREKGVECVLHSLPHRSDTVKLGIKEMAEMEGCMFVPADQPLLSHKTVAELALRFASDKEAIHRLSCKAAVGMPTVFPSALFGELAGIESGGGKAVIKRHSEILRLFEIENEAELFDADTPEMLSDLEKL